MRRETGRERAAGRARQPWRAWPGPGRPEIGRGIEGGAGGGTLGKCAEGPSRSPGPGPGPRHHLAKLLQLHVLAPLRRAWIQAGECRRGGPRGALRIGGGRRGARGAMVRRGGRRRRAEA